MQFNRRTFLKTISGAAVAGAVSTLPAFASFKQTKEPSARRPRVAVFYEPSFPAGEINLSREDLGKALNDVEALFMGVEELKSNLRAGDFDLSVNPYGAQFPKEAYSAISKYLRAGGNWINIGGVPFAVPVDREPGGWRKETRQTAYHKKLGITQAFPVQADGLHFESGVHLHGDPTSFSSGFKAEEIYEFYVRFTVVNDFPDESGTGGQRDAVLHPLLHGVDGVKRRIAAPLIRVDRLQGDYAGGRWIFAAFKGTIESEMIRSMAELAMGGAIELTARPTFACYHKGELPSFRVQLRSPRGAVENLVKEACRLEVRDERGKLIDDHSFRLTGAGVVAAANVDLSVRGRDRLAPGFYEVAVRMKPGLSHTGRARAVQFKTGFWIYDARLMGSGKPFTTDGDFLLRDGQPYPVTGTTYMASDVHRKFLFESNPYLWHQDFSEMKASGVNMVRTGIWTGWKNFMLDVGTQNEATLRAMDGFLLTARKHDIPIIFTFFSFLPEAWGGLNCYLDPRAVNAQKEFILAFVQRYRAVNDLLWDLINEPSFCNPQHLWECRPNYDAYESAAWTDWLKERYPFSTDEERIARLQEMYRTTPEEALDLPKLQEFADLNIFTNNHPLKVVDYRLFAQEMFAKWANEMAAVIKANGSRHHLVTVGQDEGGTGESPSPHFFREAVDFTCIHNWWLNDDLVWDSVVSKVPGKANLVEETGVMFYEKMDGTPWRTEVEARDLLERKLAISLGVAGAGFLEWIWNANPYMTSDNEAAIGLHRVDGTAKPELEPLVRFARFFAANRHLMKGRQAEDVIMVIPHSQQFSTRNLASEATKRSVRAMHYHCQTRMSAVSEYHLGQMKERPKLIVVPAPRAFQQKAWETLLKLVDAGSTLVFSGVIEADEHWLAVPRMNELGVEVSVGPIAQEERLSIEGTEYRVSYRGDKLQRIEKAIVDRMKIPSVMTLPHGKGSILWSPLPLEVSDLIDPTVALYNFALRTANVSPVFAVEKADPSILILPTLFADSIMYTFVSECDRDMNVVVSDTQTKAELNVDVPAQRTAVLFLDRRTGKVLAKLGY